jgi:hypothetical protein
MNLTNIKRWIKASYIQEIKKYLTGANLYIEGEDQLTDRDPKHFELRIDGPYIKPCGSKGEFRAFVEVNILVNSTRSEENIYERENLQSIAAHALNRDFCIYKTGNVGKDIADDETLLSVMQLLPSDEIKISDFGKIDTNTEVYQSTVEAHYEMYFTLTE